MERQRKNWEGPRGDLHPYANRTALWKITGKDLSGGPPLNPVVLASEGWVEALLKVSAEHHTVSRPLLFWGLAAALDLVPHGNLCQAIPAPVGTHAMAGPRHQRLWPHPVCCRLAMSCCPELAPPCAGSGYLLHPFQGDVPPLLLPSTRPSMIWSVYFSLMSFSFFSTGLGLKPGPHVSALPLIYTGSPPFYLF